MPPGASPNSPDPNPRAEDRPPDGLPFDLLLRSLSSELDHIEEPTAAELDAIDDSAELDDLDDLVALEALDTIDIPKPARARDMSQALALLAELDEPELVSLESLDDAEPEAELDDEIDDVEELLDDVEGLIEDYVDLDLEDDELQDEGYDLDDEDDGSYRDLYGDDDTIIPSFREGEFAEEEDGDTDYYNELR